MFRLKYAKTYDNKIFEKYLIKPVREDYYAVSNNIFCVADGVTRDNIKGEYVPYPETEEEVKEWIKWYPNPSGAYEAAKICGDNFIKYVKECKKEIDEKKIFDITKRINKDIWEINKNRKIDYLKDDLYACVAVGGYISKDFLYCFSVGDSHITLLDENYNMLFTTINNHKNFEEYLENIYIKKNSYDWTKAEDRAMVRKEYRNKPDKKYKGKEVSFGALTGENEAVHYIDVYKVDLAKTKFICAYSDGCEPIFDDKNRTKEIILKPDKLKEKGKERTLIIFEKKEKYEK